MTTLALRIVEVDLRRIPSRALAAMIRKADPMTCPKCEGREKPLEKNQASRKREKGIGLQLVPRYINISRKRTDNDE
ncbi:MAG: hypothetical protein A2Y86_02255 [Candidatus Aminicenantes bacterium RBG_13_62_12]|nr:MAG: hypothetical protein A2Y86_02255 [Candidatus Aminicenantes bacterium RBG_13_62_12]